MSDHVHSDGIDQAQTADGLHTTTSINSVSSDENTSATAQVAYIDGNDKETSVQQMQSLIQSSADLTFPLEDSWTFWFFKNDRQPEWKDNLMMITTVSTVESFWSVYNHLKMASGIVQGCDYLLFKTHIVSCLLLTCSKRETRLDKFLSMIIIRLATDVGRSIQSIWRSMVD
jgi:hypothetical protein